MAASSKTEVKWWHSFKKWQLVITTFFFFKGKCLKKLDKWRAKWVNCNMRGKRTQKEVPLKRAWTFNSLLDQIVSIWVVYGTFCEVTFSSPAQCPDTTHWFLVVWPIKKKKKNRKEIPYSWMLHKKDIFKNSSFFLLRVLMTCVIFYVNFSFLLICKAIFF